jgi:thiosulfate dehydrogenase
MLALSVGAVAWACGTRSPAPPAAAGGAADTTLRAPDGSGVPEGPLGASIRRGHAILAATHDSLPLHVGNALRCLSCHLDDGRRPNAMPFTGVFTRYPQYRSRSASVQTIEDRINGCFQRSMNGTALAPDDPAMRDIVAYYAFLSRGIAVGDTVPGQGLPKVAALGGDTTAGAAVFVAQCSRCHGPDGNGLSVAGSGGDSVTVYPPLWGPRSFNIGAGMARFRTAAGFILHNMPFDKPGSLSETEALNVAAYVTSRPRPDFAGKENDWPKGDAPADAAYPTRAGRKAATGQ